MGKQFLSTADTGKACSAVWGTNCNVWLWSRTTSITKDPKNMSDISLYFHGFEVLRKPGWIVHSLLTLPPSFSFVSSSASEKMSPWLSSWWIPGWLSAGADGLLCSLLHAPVVSAVQSAELTESINHSWMERFSESSGPIWDVLMWLSLTYTRDLCGWGSQIWLPGSHMPQFGLRRLG